MKAGRALDSDIAIKVMKLKMTNPNDIPCYSTNTYAAYEVINKMQHQGWSFHVKENITPSGGLLYRSRFEFNTQRTEQYSPSLPMSICLAALAIVDHQYVEFINEQKDDEQTIGIVGSKEVPTILKKANIESLESLFTNKIDKFEFPSDNQLKFNDILSKDDLEKLPKKLLTFFVDILDKNNYFIVKKPEDK